jgi:Peptidase propeptide and YPEB domain
LVESKSAEKRSCTERLKGREIAYMPVVTLTPMASEIDHRNLTNRVCQVFVVFGESHSYHERRRMHLGNLKKGSAYRLLTHDRRDAMRQLPCTTAMLAGLFAMLLLTTAGVVVTAQAARTTKALTAAQATACIQTAVAAQAGMVTKVEVEDKGGRRLCEVGIVDDSGKKHKLQIDANTNQVVKTR